MFAAIVGMMLSLILLPLAGIVVNKGKEQIIITEESVSCGGRHTADGVPLGQSSVLGYGIHHWKR